jgi:hypothetical protein
MWCLKSNLSIMTSPAVSRPSRLLCHNFIRFDRNDVYIWLSLLVSRSFFVIFSAGLFTETILWDDSHQVQLCSVYHSLIFFFYQKWECVHLCSIFCVFLSGILVMTISQRSRTGQVRGWDLRPDLRPGSSQVTKILSKKWLGRSLRVGLGIPVQRPICCGEVVIWCRF